MKNHKLNIGVSLGFGVLGFEHLPAGLLAFGPLGFNLK
jgi:hypothetical protein